MTPSDPPISLWESIKPYGQVDLIDGESALSESEVGELVRANNFYSSESNPSGEGLHFPLLDRFSLYYNGEIVYDRSTGLSWQRGGSDREVSQSKAESYVLELVATEYGELRGWQLPSLVEAMSLVMPLAENFNHNYPHLVPLHIDPVFDPTQRWIWTRNLSPQYTEAWVAQFAQANYQLQDKITSCYVRAVTRDRPKADLLEKVDREQLQAPPKTQEKLTINYGITNCDFCKGTGKQPCQMCNGSGSMTNTYTGPYQTQIMTTPCIKCAGSGQVKCSRCHPFG